MENTFIDFLNSSPHQNGFLTFVVGILFVLTVYHFMLYFQHKNKSYIYYSSYTLLIFITYFTMSENDFLVGFTKPIKPFFKLTHLGWVWIYNIIYFFFVFHFLKFKKHYTKTTKFISNILYLLLVIAIITLLVSISSNSIYYLTQAYTYIFLPVVISLSIYCFYLVYISPETAKTYIFVGSFILFSSSILATLAVDFNLVFKNTATGYLVFYVGVILENICFSLGLGLRQKIILNERDTVNKKLIANLRENELLKESINKQLKEKINVLNQQISLKKEIEDLKLTALRSQMNPHFIFNALNSIKLYIINNERKNAAFYLNKFSKLMRKILEASSIKVTSLKEELETMELYMSIENIRFSDAIDYCVEISEDVKLEGIKIPPLVLQPFLENALWHGLSSKKGSKKINICVDKIDGNHLQIIIKDNGIGRKAAARIKSEKSINRKSIGINLTNERMTNFVKNLKNDYSIFYEDLVDDNKATGTEVILKIPLK